MPDCNCNLPNGGIPYTLASEDSSRIFASNEKLFLRQLQELLRYYVFLSDLDPDPEVRAAFKEANDFVVGQKKVVLGGDRLSFEEAMSQVMGLELDSLEFKERFSDFRRNILKRANDAELQWEKRNAHL